MVKVIKLINTPSSSSINLSAGIYKFECWGAQGGTGLMQGNKVHTGGKGAYTSGIISFVTRKELYLFVGGIGANGSATPNTIAAGGYNGGGNGGPDTTDDEGAGGGGGSSDIRLVNGEWNDTKSILSRIMVAAGGSGSADEAYGAPGGALKGFKLTANKALSFAYSTTNQTNGYKLGIGENGRPHQYTPSSGAGGGYYGGLAVNGIGAPIYEAVSSSGTSFVSGYRGCDAVDENGAHTGSPIHYSKHRFINPIMKTGDEEFLSPDKQKETGHAGDGAILITYLGGISQFRSYASKLSIIVSQLLSLIYS